MFANGRLEAFKIVHKKRVVQPAQHPFVQLEGSFLAEQVGFSKFASSSVRRRSTMRFQACAAFLSVSLNSSFLESIVLVSLRNTSVNVISLQLCDLGTVARVTLLTSDMLSAFSMPNLFSQNKEKSTCHMKSHIIISKFGHDRRGTSSANSEFR